LTFLTEIAKIQLVDMHPGGRDGQLGVDRLENFRQLEVKSKKGFEQGGDKDQGKASDDRQNNLLPD
jgi:hypothetical protein